MQQDSIVFFGGNDDGLNVPARHNFETLQWPVGVAGRETYIRETLSLGDVSITIYRHESLTREQVLENLIEYYQAWCVNGLGGRRNR